MSELVKEHSFGSARYATEEEKQFVRSALDGAELNPPTDTLSTSNNDGWIEEGGDINTEMEIFRERME